jgi:hypothetical protein
MDERRMVAPAAGRNRGAILAVLRRVLPVSGLVLEVASGSGEHAAYFAAGMPGLVFQPSDPDPARRASIDAWCEGLANVRPALDLDATGEWGIRADTVLCINMIHIAPWAATLGLMRNAAVALAEGAPLLLYGPFRRGGEMAPSNAAFDAELRGRNPAWGVRDLEEVVAAAEGFALAEVVEMPANNLCVVLRRG